MQQSKHKWLVWVVLMLLFAFWGYAVLCFSLQAIPETNVNFYLAAGNTLSGTVTAMYREPPTYVLEVYTAKFGTLIVECTQEQYLAVKPGTVIDIDFVLQVKEAL